MALRPWLYRIAHNAALNVARDPQVGLARVPEGLDGRERPEDVVQQREHLDRVVNAMKALPENQREVIARRELGGESHERIAADLGMSAGAVRQLAYRARAAVRAAAAAVIPGPVIRMLPWLGGGPGMAATGAGPGRLAKTAVVVVVAGAAGGGAVDSMTGREDARAAAAGAEATEAPAAPPRRPPAGARRAASRRRPRGRPRPEIVPANPTRRHGRRGVRERRVDNSGPGASGSSGSAAADPAAADRAAAAPAAAAPAAASGPAGSSGSGSGRADRAAARGYATRADRAAARAAPEAAPTTSPAAARSIEQRAIAAGRAHGCPATRPRSSPARRMSARSMAS